MSNRKKSLWIRWVAANAFSELLGLGATFITIGVLFSRIDTQQTAGIFLSFFIAVLSGAIEATVVGLAQWWAMNPFFPMIGRLAWWRATLAGALLAYALGYLPSTLMSAGEAATQTPQEEPAQWLTLLLAFILGAVAGALLSFAQWLVLRNKVKRSWLWIPGNMLAWAIGMPIIFLGIDLAFRMNETWQSVLIIGGAVLAVGAIVGAINGRFLVILAGEEALITA
jgi:hypothetical protein